MSDGKSSSSAAAAIDYQEIHDVLVQIALQAGEMITSAQPAVSGHGTKKDNSADLVTETDQAVEKMIMEELGRKYPGFEFMGEETYQPGDILSSTPTFIIDPIDGTTNFFHGWPYVAVSLGLAVDKKPVVGVVYNPFTQTLYSGITGRGAYMTTRPCPSNSNNNNSKEQEEEKEEKGKTRQNRLKLPLKTPLPFQNLSHCLIGLEWGHGRTGPDYELKARLFRKLCASKTLGGAHVHDIRSLGSAALNICAVACGWLDLEWETGTWAWDVCAAWVILEEAGGRMVGAMKGDWEPQVDQRRYLAVRGGEGQEGIIEEFWGCIEGKIEVGWDAVS